MPALPAGWEVIHGDVRALPFGAGEFDVEVASYVLHALAEGAVHTALSELARVLAPHGRLVTVTPIVPGAGILRPRSRRIGRDGAPRSRQAGRPTRPGPSPRPRTRRLHACLRALSNRGYPSLCVLGGGHGSSRTFTAPSSFFWNIS